MKTNKRPKLEFGNLPRDGYVYSLYRGHVLRLGLVAAGLLLILIWAWSGSWKTVYSNLFPADETNYQELSELQTELALPTEIPDKLIFYRSLVMQDNNYRHMVQFDDVKPENAENVYRVSAEGYHFFALADEMPKTGEPYEAVLTLTPAPLAAEGMPNCTFELRDIPVGTEKADTAEMLLLTPAVLIILVWWLIMLKDPTKHPIYRQLGRYGMRIDTIVAAIDREFAAGNIISQSKKVIMTPGWVLKRSAFNTMIYKNTNPAAAAAAQEEIAPR